MKRINHVLIIVMLFCVLLLGGCFSTPSDKTDINTNPTKIESKPIQTLDTFELVLDEKMSYVENSSSKYYNLVLYAGEKYQVKTTVDDIIGSDYYLKYSIDGDISDLFSLSDKGYIEVISELNESEVYVIDVELYQKDSNKKVASKYFVLSLRVGEYVDFTLTNEDLEYDETNSTYTLKMDSGSRYYLAYSVTSNTAYVITYTLKDSSYASFMSVNDEGVIFTTETTEDKVGEIVIKIHSGNGLLDEISLKVYLRKGEEAKNELKVYNLNDSTEITDSTNITIYKNEEVSFDVKYNNQYVTNVITFSDTNVLEVENTTNTIKALKEGTCEVVFQYEEEQITITVKVIKDKAIAIEALNQGSDFIMVNGSLHYLGNLYIKYESGRSEEIKDHSLLKVVINDKDEHYKAVSFTYHEITITYDVKYYHAKEYEGDNTTYVINDLFNNYVYGTANVLPNDGKVKLLVIPVWFNDSNKFFNESQKPQIIEDIEYTMNSTRPNTELYSVKQYYEMQSYGAIQMDIKVSDFYYSSTSYCDYSDNLDTKVSNSHILATDAINWYFANNLDENFEDYDLNNDGYLDGVVLLYGANYYGAKNDKNNSYAFASVNSDDVEYAYNTMCFCPIGGLYGLAKKEATTQLTIEDLSNTYDKAFNNSSRVIIHEIGHMFGNKDLYEKRSSEERYYPAGSFVMQSQNYGGHDPHHVNLIGWSKPDIYASSDYELGDKITVKLSDFQSTGQNIILTNKWNAANSLFDEYLIIELFAPTGLNEYDSKIMYLNTMPIGIRLWHANSLMVDYFNDMEYSNEILKDHLYDFGTSNHDVEKEYDTLHLIRNNPLEEYNTSSMLPSKNILFEAGDSFDMETYKSQFINGSKLDNGDKLGWSFVVDAIYMTEDGTYDAIITLERTDNIQTDFTQTIKLNRDDLETPDGVEDYSKDIFGEDSEFIFTYKYMTPPSIFVQEYPISSNGMCLFAASDGNGGYIDLTIKEIDGKEVNIESISITYSYLTNASLTVIADEKVIEGVSFKPANSEAYGYTFVVNSSSVRIQNQYHETINHWSVIALYEITINYTIK